MTKTNESSTRIPISPEFFCDGHFYVLTSTSLGGSSFTPSDISNILGESNEGGIEQLLQQGVCIPLYFDPDCELDGCTLFVLGDLTEEEENQWVGKLSWKLNIPCGKLVLLCGGVDEGELAHAISGDPPEEHYEIFQVIEVPPDEYLVEIYAYQESYIARDYLDAWDDDMWEREDDAIAYIIRLTPLTTEPPLPQLVPDMGWCGIFEFRESK
jgi:hypothetical protein